MIVTLLMIMYFSDKGNLLKLQDCMFLKTQAGRSLFSGKQAIQPLTITRPVDRNSLVLEKNKW